MERDDTNMITSQRVTWTIEKTKQLPSIGTHGHYYVLPQEGRIDQYRELLDIAVEMNIIERRGAWFFYKEEKWNGNVNAFYESIGNYNTDLTLTANGGSGTGTTITYTVTNGTANG